VSECDIASDKYSRHLDGFSPVGPALVLTEASSLSGERTMTISYHSSPPRLYKSTNLVSTRCLKKMEQGAETPVLNTVELKG